MIPYRQITKQFCIWLTLNSVAVLYSGMNRSVSLCKPDWIDLANLSDFHQVPTGTRKAAFNFRNRRLLNARQLRELSLG